MMPVGERDGGENIMDMVARIPAVRDFEPAPVVARSSKFYRQYLRKLLTFTQGPMWSRCTIQEHTMPGGARAFSATVYYSKHRHSETWIAVVKEDGELVFALPVEN